MSESSTSRVNLLREEISAFVSEAQEQARKRNVYARFWNLMDVLTGVPAVALAAVAGVTGLVSATNRVMAAILALAAAAFTAAAGYLECSRRYKGNRRYGRAWQTLAWEGRYALASHPDDASALRSALAELLKKRRSLMDHDYSLIFGSSQPKRNESVMDSTASPAAPTPPPREAPKE